MTVGGEPYKDLMAVQIVLHRLSFVFVCLFPKNQSVRNKPSSLSYWLHGLSSDSQELPEDDDIIVSIGKGTAKPSC